MTHLRPLGYLDVWPVVATLYERRDLFDKETLRQEFPGSPHKDTRAIILHEPANGFAGWFEDVPHVPTYALAAWNEMQDLLPRVAKAVNRTVADLGKVMLVELAPGGAIGWHRDEGLYSVAYSRYHLALLTNPHTFLYSGGESLHLPVGVLAAFDTQALHSAINVGNTPRTHLIVDLRTPQ